MPAKTLPRKLVARLTNASEALDRSLARMKNIDHRRNHPARKVIKTSPEVAGVWGGRIRQFDVSKNYPGVELVIKKIHNFRFQKATTELQEIKRKVLVHNQNLINQGIKANYVLREPIAYDLGNGLVAMAKTNKPSLEEIFGCSRLSPTIKGIKFFRKLSKKHKLAKKQLKDAAEQVQKEASLDRGNLILLGVDKQRRFIFMPLVDLF